MTNFATWKKLILDTYKLFVMAETKYIFVTGGVASSLGKGVISSSIGKLLQARGYNVTIQKFDPYININPGTLNPNEHGECYVTVDGHEADLDLGHYERFLGVNMTKANNITTGRIYKRVIDRELPGARKEVLLVLDATTGQNAVQQAKQFGAVTDVTGIVLTKLDGTAKGGIVLPIHTTMGYPVKFVCVGETIEDMLPFDAESFAEALI